MLDLSGFSSYLEVAVLANFSYPIFKDLRKNTEVRIAGRLDIDKKLLKEAESTLSDAEDELIAGFRQKINEASENLVKCVRPIEFRGAIICSITGSLCVALIYSLGYRWTLDFSWYIEWVIIVGLLLLIVPTPYYYFRTMRTCTKIIKQVETERYAIQKAIAALNTVGKKLEILETLQKAVDTPPEIK